MVDPDAEELQRTTKEMVQHQKLSEDHPGAIEKAEAAYLAACDLAKASLMVWNLEAVSGPVWDELVSGHPPKDDDPEGWEVHLPEFAPAVLNEIVTGWVQGETSGELSLKDAIDIWQEWDEHTATALFTACREVQEGRASAVPFPIGTGSLTDDQLIGSLEQLGQSLQSLDDH